MAEVTKEVLQVFVKSLATRESGDIEKFLVHLLDTSRNRWNRKASEFLRQMNDKDLDAEALAALEASYKHAAEQGHRISRMRYGVARPKRLVGGVSVGGAAAPENKGV
jgi:hypothetical protein